MTAETMTTKSSALRMRRQFAKPACLRLARW